MRVSVGFHVAFDLRILGGVVHLGFHVGFLIRISPGCSNVHVGFFTVSCRVSFAVSLGFHLGFL